MAGGLPQGYRGAVVVARRVYIREGIYDSVLGVFLIPTNVFMHPVRSIHGARAIFRAGLRHPRDDEPGILLRLELAGPSLPTALARP